MIAPTPKFFVFLLTFFYFSVFGQQSQVFSENFLDLMDAYDTIQVDNSSDSINIKYDRAGLVSIDLKNDFILFDWSKIKGAHSSYQLKLYEYSITTNKPFLSYKHQPILEHKVFGKQYAIKQEGFFEKGKQYLIQISSLEMNTGDGIEFLFTYDYPECPSLENIDELEVGNDFFEVVWDVPFDASIVKRYEVRLKDKTKNGSWHWYGFQDNTSFRATRLVQDHTYILQVRKYCSYPNSTFEYKSEWAEIEVTPTDFKEGECLDVSTDMITSNSIFLSWSDAPASPTGDFMYKVKYWVQGDPTTLNVFDITDGNSFLLSNLLPNTAYEVVVVRIHFSNKNGSCTEQVGVITTIGEMDLPECGANIEPVEIFNNVPIGVLKVDTTISVNGFPLKLTSVTKNPDGTFKGEGVIPIPFQLKKLQVTFQSIEVNPALQVFSGLVQSKSVDESLYPDFTSNIDYGGEICVELPQVDGWDENGLWQPAGTPYDPYGYDEEGIHYLTGTEFGPDGCSVDLVDENKKICSHTSPPFYWSDLDAPVGEPTAEGVVMANKYQGQLKELIVQALDELRDVVVVSIDEKRGEATTLRAEINQLVGTLDISAERPFLFGENEEYFNEGLSNEFVSAPKKFGTNIDGRDPNIILLENNHVDLYNNDKELMSFLSQELVITSEGGDDKVVISVNELTELIKVFSADEAAQYATIEDLYPWVLEKMSIKINYLILGLDEYGAKDNDIEDLEQFDPPMKYVSSPYFDVVDISIDNDELRKAIIRNRGSQDDLAYQFKQGWDKIYGVDRAFFVEALASHLSNNPPPGIIDAQLAPVSIISTPLGNHYEVYFDNFKFGPTSSFVDAYFILTIPNSGDRIVFKALGIDLTPSGVGAATLVLGSDIGIRLNNAARLNIKATENTFISLDCDGFAGMGIEADVEFCRKYLLPLDDDLEIIEDPSVLVEAHFVQQMAAWGQFEVGLSIDPFTLPKVKDFKFEVGTAWLDFSDVSTNTDIVKFPTNYTTPFMNSGVPISMWKGFYLDDITVTIPKGFKDENQEEITVNFNDLIIDNRGVTGKFMATPILSLDKGTIGTWAFSIDNLFIEIVANKLVHGEFNGDIHVPILKGKNSGSTDPITKDDCLSYVAIINESGFVFSLQPFDKDYSAPVWMAEVTIDKSSYIDLVYENGDFIATAVLNGDLSIKASSLNKITVDSIRFEQLRISSKPNYFETGVWSFPGSVGSEIYGYKMHVSDVGVGTKYVDGIKKVFLGFATEVKLTDNTEGLVGKTSIDVIGKLEFENGRQKWSYDKFKINRVELTGQCRGIDKIHGELEFFDNTEGYEEYGVGFRARVDLSLSSEKKMLAKFVSISTEIGVAAQFGRVGEGDDAYKYFFVDARVGFSPGIPKVSTFKLHGFSGGAYKHMQRDTTNEGVLSSSSDWNIGKSLSGIKYIPNKDKSIGLKAGVAFSMGGEKKFSGNVKLEVLFSNNGISNIWFDGEGQFMRKDKMDPFKMISLNSDETPPVTAKVAVRVHIDLDFKNNIYQGDLVTFFNENKFKGTGPYGRVGEAKFYFAPNIDEWYIYIGTPEDPWEIEFANLAKINFYLDIGTKIPKMPDLPTNVKSLLNAEYFMANESSRATGRGFAFGASLGIDKDFDFLIFYADIAADLGFDVMVQDYGDAKCAGSGDQIGINGWYASGQIYAFVRADVGIRAKLFGKNVEKSILDLSVAAALQTKLPKPFWAKGMIGGRYNICGGLIKGDCNFEFELGDQCNIVGGEDPNTNFAIIDQVLPANKMFVEPSAIPIVSFNVPIGEKYGVDQADSYTAELDYFDIKSFNGYAIQGDVIWSPSKRECRFESRSYFEHQDSFIISIGVIKYKNGISYETEERQDTFYTNDQAITILDDNIEYSYPIQGQEKFHSNEWNENKGYIKLKRGQPDIFSEIPDGYKQLLVIENSLSEKDELQYNYQFNEISFYFPNSYLELSESYTIRLVNVKETYIDQYLTTSQGNDPAIIELPLSYSYSSSGSGGFLKNEPSIDYDYSGPIKNDKKSNSNILEIMDLEFSTSQFTSFNEKINHFKDNASLNTESSGYVLGYQMPSSISEPIGKYVFSSVNGMAPLVSFSTSENDWTFHIRNMFLIDEDGNIEPFETCLDLVTLLDPILEDYRTEQFWTDANGSNRLVLSFPKELISTFYDKKNAAMQYLLNNCSGNIYYDGQGDNCSNCQDWLNSFEISAPNLEVDGFETTMKYALPGKGIVTSVIKIKFEN